MAFTSLASAPKRFVTTDGRGHFLRGDSIYTFAGTNLWYAPILASDGRGGNPQRLQRELDRLQSLGVTNLRILAGAEGPEGLPHHISPVLQTAPGVYNDTLLTGLDRLMAELERRDMTAVIYLTNSWEWSGGYGSYLQWTGKGVAPVPGIDGYQEYVDHVKEFVLNDSARSMALDHIRFMVGRTNSVTGRPYIDPNHLVSTGSEGAYGCEIDLDLWRRIHTSPEIDYAIIHLWPTNWGWASRDSVEAHIDRAIACSDEYIDEHLSAIRDSGRPLVIQEFGYPRDGFSFSIEAPVTARDKYYRHIIERCAADDRIAGFNFWGWNGEARPAHELWQPGDDYCCDPAHEPQGMYGVFDCDSTTLQLIRPLPLRASGEEPQGSGAR